ncbi:hypothetical protein CFOL_v3_07754 [Cephalotus follicularis]|uniref:Uncharacterized protein n=1 Tax=Cephalotus follicularis TaxID=3775 RepID=A0A1Q3B863_CEPFO|nr:hypothetical protein CFOL_v3_07754 [Cephalotus follicularis]
MQVQSLSLGLPAHNFKLSNHYLLSHKVVSPSHLGFKSQSARLGNPPKFYLMRALSGLKRGAITCASNSESNTKLDLLGNENSGVAVRRYNGVDPFRGKSGSVSFKGLTYEQVEEGKLVSAPFNENKGSFLWVLAPIALITSLLVPQFFLGNVIEDISGDLILGEILTSLSSEAMFYIGLATFLLVTDHVQRPYLQFSPKRWGLITGLRGYLTSSFFAMGVKVIAPLFVVYVTWPVLGLPALVAVVPFLVGCASQRAFELGLEKRGSSCWPLVPVIFEVYRIFQLTKAAHFIQRLMFSMPGLPESPDLRGALIAMIVTFQVLGVVCLWSLLTFLMRLFPSRPVSENY